MHKFCRHFTFGRVDYVIDHEDQSKSEEHRNIDYEFLRLIAQEKSNHLGVKIFSIILLMLSITFAILNGVAIEQGAYLNVLGITLAIMFEVVFCLASFILFVFVGSLMDDDDYLRNIEDLYELTDAGKIQREKVKEEFNNKEKQKNDRKADQLITTYDTLDSDMKRERKIEIISKIIKNMENDNETNN